MSESEELECLVAYPKKFGPLPQVEPLNVDDLGALEGGVSSLLPSNCLFASTTFFTCF